jgi:hypothetical protein
MLSEVGSSVRLVQAWFRFDSGDPSGLAPVDAAEPPVPDGYCGLGFAAGRTLTNSGRQKSYMMPMLRRQIDWVMSTVVGLIVRLTGGLVNT